METTHRIGIVNKMHDPEDEVNDPDWVSAIKRSLRFLGLHPTEGVEAPLKETSIYKEMPKIWKDAYYEPYNEEKQRHKMRGLTLENPLRKDDKDYKEQFEFCMMIIGNCFVMEYVNDLS